MLDKALITRADDFGSSHSANQAIYEVSKKGIVKNVSVMACAPYLEEAAEMLASSKDVTFGMHSVINAEWDRMGTGSAEGESEKSDRSPGRFLPGRVGAGSGKAGSG